MNELNLVFGEGNNFVFQIYPRSLIFPRMENGPECYRDFYNWVIRNINHEYLHKILFELESRSACVDLDNFKDSDGKIRDIVAGMTVE